MGIWVKMADRSPGVSGLSGSSGPLTNMPRGPQDGAQSLTTPYAIVIDPSALPSGAGLQIWTSGTPGAADNFKLPFMGEIHGALTKRGVSPAATGAARHLPSLALPG